MLSRVEHENSLTSRSDTGERMGTLNTIYFTSISQKAPGTFILHQLPNGTNKDADVGEFGLKWWRHPENAGETPLRKHVRAIYCNISRL